jgi:hypothetical protein
MAGEDRASLQTIALCLRIAPCVDDLGWNQWCPGWHKARAAGENQSRKNNPILQIFALRLRAVTKAVIKGQHTYWTGVDPSLRH